MNVQGFPFVCEQQVTFRDIDMLGHVNNAVYATYLENARLAYIYAAGGEAASSLPLILAELNITYKSPAFFRETLQIGARIQEIRNSSFVMESQIVEKESQRLVALNRAIIVHYDYATQRPAPLPAEWRERFERFEGRAL